MPIQKTNLDNKDEVSIDIDLERLLGGAANNREVREVFFQAAFDLMVDKLDNGIGADGSSLKPAYSKSYKNSLEYEVFGKDGTVNMQLTGGMVQSLNILAQNATTMKVGFEGEESVKAFAHMTGYEGHPTLDGKVKPRKFFGWKDSELIKIAEDLKPAANRNQSSLSDSKILNLLDRLLK